MKCFFIIFTLLAIVALALADGGNPCMMKCNKMFKPVCASDADGTFKTYPNECVFRYNACLYPARHMKIVSQGPCDKV